ncbi:hypothetical protein PPERSA_12353 [Pseudocohnilembus persalinus]|uniref:DUF1754-domain-containing protein n=1 Tax=Pseudocohnilembus persalinus TaxID=266149 RepID=A0A0V0R0W7_PSEPJ|nr:hypothetical protein PPERSA_12353 [Pseudocohnilembus persalinus]|eukprot:KRX08198.1 hypothetical protein PPERSA_12353 [Pseudocohnilembus persalinus]
MSLKFKGNKSVNDVLKKQSKGKSGSSLLEKRTHSQLEQQSQPQTLKQQSTKNKYLQVTDKNNYHKLKGQKEKEELERQKQLQEIKKTQQVTQQIQKTDAEISYEIIKKKRMAERIQQKLGNTYRDKVKEFNEKLNGMTQHFDLPKIGPG